MTEKTWYHEGIQFECTGCGACCKDHGNYSFVYLLPDDIAAIAAQLGLNTEDFIQEYCLRNEELVYLKMKGPDCPFLEQGKCNVYTVRPKQCRTWPFWQENLEKETWDRDVVPFCPGVGRGPRFSAEQIKAIADSLEQGFLDMVRDYNPYTGEEYKN